MVIPSWAYHFVGVLGVIAMCPDEVTVKAHRGQGPDDVEEEISFTEQKVIGKGTFGVVCLAQMSKTGEMVAVKKVLHDERFKVGMLLSSCCCLFLLLGPIYTKQIVGPTRRSYGGYVRHVKPMTSRSSIG